MIYTLTIRVTTPDADSPTDAYLRTLAAFTRAGLFDWESVEVEDEAGQRFQPKEFLPPVSRGTNPEPQGPCMDPEDVLEDYEAREKGRTDGLLES